MIKVYRQLRNKIEVTDTGRYVIFLFLGCLVFSFVLGLFFALNDLEFQRSTTATIGHFLTVTMTAILLTLAISMVSIGLALKYKS